MPETGVEPVANPAIRGYPWPFEGYRPQMATDGDVSRGGSTEASAEPEELPPVLAELATAYSAHHAEMQLYLWADRVDLADGELVAANDAPEGP